MRWQGRSPTTAFAGSGVTACCQPSGHTFYGFKPVRTLNPEACAYAPLRLAIHFRARRAPLSLRARTRPFSGVPEQQTHFPSMNTRRTRAGGPSGTKRVAANLGEELTGGRVRASAGGSTKKIKPAAEHPPQEGTRRHSESQSGANRQERGQGSTGGHTQDGHKVEDCGGRDGEGNYEVEDRSVGEPGGATDGGSGPNPRGLADDAGVPQDPGQSADGESATSDCLPPHPGHQRLACARGSGGARRATRGWVGAVIIRDHVSIELGHGEGTATDDADFERIPHHHGGVGRPHRHVARGFRSAETFGGTGSEVPGVHAGETVTVQGQVGHGPDGLGGRTRFPG